MHNRILFALTLTANLLLAACGDNLEPSEPDAGAGAATCEPTPDRNTSCRSICRADVELCPGETDWTVCFAECRNGVAAGGWCPGQQAGGL